MPEEPDFGLVPADLGVSPDDEVIAAEASVLEDPALLDQPEPLPVPLGRTWDFNWETGRFRRVGGAPVEIRGRAGVAQWCQMVVHCAVGAHAALPDDFGLDLPDDPIGEVVGSLGPEELEERLREGLTQSGHERVMDLIDFTSGYVEDALAWSGTVVLDDEDEVELTGAPRPPEVDGG